MTKLNDKQIEDMYLKTLARMVAKEIRHIDKMNPDNKLTLQEKTHLAYKKIGSDFKKVITWE